ncbi:MAG: hypothetical protein KC619_10835 [Myxococcales bacterium]|nr:hypothetical protein [Myxococcales bacterium]
MWRGIATIALLGLAGCGGEPTADGGASADAAFGADAARADAGIDASEGDAGCASTTYRIVDVGYCFDALTCCTAADCGPEGTWTCNPEGLCEQLGRACGCADDLDCAPGALCITNAVVCGVCVEPGELCIEDRNCSTGRCIDGYCVDDTRCQGY